MWRERSEEGTGEKNKAKKKAGKVVSEIGREGRELTRARFLYMNLFAIFFCLLDRTGKKKASEVECGRGKGKRGSDGKRGKNQRCAGEREKERL